MLHPVIVGILVCISSATAQNNTWIINPGVKLGLIFGPEIQFIGGAEVSVTVYSEADRFAVGALISFEQGPGMYLTHIAAEVFPYLLTGISIGPTFVHNNEHKSTGYSATLFGGAFALPYYRFSDLSDFGTFHEAGFFFKLPLALQKQKFRL